MNTVQGWVHRVQAWFASKANEARESAAREAKSRHEKRLVSWQKEVAAAFRWPEHDGSMSIVGESFYQADLKRIAGDHGKKFLRLEAVALIKPEDDNPHDEKAVSVWINGYKVGHLDREDARSFRRRLSAKKLTNQVTACSAMVLGGHVRESGERSSYGVELSIKPFV